MTPPQLNGAWKKWIGAGVAVLLLADLALGVFLWQNSRDSEQSRRAEREKLALKAKLMNADVKRTEQIRGALPKLAKTAPISTRRRFRTLQMVTPQSSPTWTPSLCTLG